ncbi:MAG TPA: nitroreductase family protein [Candidatus Acidoferrales bacterium]|nr:nitroreductase family protein [Candidatus Acidoferrales bacterium]
MGDPEGTEIRAAVKPLLRVRQIREFTAEAPNADQLRAVTDAARWTGSSMNSQPWRFIVIRDRSVLARIHDAGLPQTRSLRTAPAAVAIVLPEDDHAVSRAYDDGRAAERMLIAAELVGLRAGIAWITSGVRPLVRELLGLPEDRFVRTIVVVGHPTEAALAPKNPPGKGRLPRDEVVFEERWPAATGGSEGDGEGG